MGQVARPVDIPFSLYSMNCPCAFHSNQLKMENKEKKQSVYLPGQPMEEDEELVVDESAYIMLHNAQTGAPCLSFDIIQDKLGEKREDFPLTMYMAAGTQSDKKFNNNVIVLKMSNMHKTQKAADDSDDESDDDDDEDSETKPKLEHVMIKHIGCVNRIRTKNINDVTLAATWSEEGYVNIWNLDQQLNTLEDPELLAAYKQLKNIRPMFSFKGHPVEGYAIDWSSVTPGVLASGDCRRNIHVWQPQEDGTWHVDQRPLIGHTNSVEDLQWSPNEANVLASCSVDKSIRIWDTREAPNKACALTASNAHESDINVINWNKNEPLIVSGGDDGQVLIWDLRVFEKGSPVATFKHHTDAVTTVEWHPTDSSVFASGGDDNQIVLWDLAVEKDTSEKMEEDDVKEVPPQLLFIHQGQKEIKELHWHPQIPGLMTSTALNGFNVFRTISV